ncbi:MAG: TetR/AcrR family transcriptional regulator [Myxococcales bacterium]|nr:TetR/AcrR family transcriptional regulator [Myxococcales bacterium]
MTPDASVVLERLQRFIGDIDPATAKGRKRAAILAAASERFVAKGYRETSMDEIAAAVGVAKGTLYLYFPKKIDLLIACSAKEKLELMPMVMSLFQPGLSAEQRLKQWIIMLLTWPGRAPLNSKLVEGDFAEVMADLPPELVAENTALQGELIAPLVDEVAGHHRWSPVEIGDRVTVLSALGMLGPMLRHDWIGAKIAPDRFATLIADLIIDGLRPRPAP